MQTTTYPEMTPGLMSVLPLFYVGWADSVLGPSEFDFIHDKIHNLEFLSPEEQELMISWTRPNQPPEESTFQWWITEMRRHAINLNDLEKKSLVEIGIELAKHGTQFDSDHFLSSPRTRQALIDLQEALGIEPSLGQDIILHKINRPSTVNEKEYSFDPKSMQDILDQTYSETRNRVRKLLRDPFFELNHERDKTAYRDKILDWTKELAEQGFGAYVFPKEYGGQGKTGDHITVFEMLGFHDLSLAVKFGVQFGLFGGAIYNLGTSSHHDKYLADLGRAELLGCFAMTETGHGSNVKGLETNLTYDHRTRTINVHSPSYEAGKEYIGNALHGKLAVVFGQLIVDGKSHGIHAVVVPMRDDENNIMPGVKIEDCGYKMGLNGVDNGRIWFDNVVVPVEELLDKHGQINKAGEYQSSITSDSRRFFTMLSALVAGRICVALASVSASKKALQIAIEYALKRRQFEGKKGEPETLIMDYPSHQKRLFPLLAKTYGLDLALKNLTDTYVADHDEDTQRMIETRAAGLKAIASWHATQTIQECREACGGKGYLAENQLTDLKADTDIFATFEGDNTVLLQLVAKGLLSDMKKYFHDEGYMAVMRQLGQRIGHTLSEYNIYQSRKTDTEHLLDFEFYYDAFRYRQDKLLDQVASRMQKYIGKRIHPTDAFLRCQNHMIELARAHVDVLVLKAYYKQYKTMEDGPTKKAFVRLYQLYALHTIESNKDYFLENDYMDGQKTKAIRRVINKLYADIRPDAQAYVKAFGIPGELLKAPIVV